MSTPHFRYEIEYDENRLEIGRDIGKRFLGIPYADDNGDQQHNNTITGTDGSDCGGVGEENDSGIDSTTAHPTQQQQQLQHNQHKHPPSHNKHSAYDKTFLSSKCYVDSNADELVLDVLNDDLISKVQEKITRKYLQTFFTVL